jgi:5-formaminoimidazole-4-carboxamide-1-(beta)-D-ribofuranosyl 5'-monophosphate synthetase
MKERDAVLIPHGTLIAQMPSEQIESIGCPMFGNRWILRWESDRDLKESLMTESGLNVPRKVASPGDIDRLVIVKRQGAAGGKGYFMASDPKEYDRKRLGLIRQGVVSEDEQLYIQEYVSGVLAYLQYFYSPLSCELEFFGVDRRHESDIEGLSRIPAELQITRDTVPSFNVIANSPMVLRESLLEEVYGMGERFVEASKRLAGPGMNGPFCIEGVYDSDAEFTAFEFSARIVAGTNIYMEGSPYSALLYGEPMSMGRRIARELAMAARSGRIGEVTT